MGTPLPLSSRHGDGSSSAHSAASPSDRRRSRAAETRAIFAPGTPQQCYDLTRHAVEVAHKHQSPVILMSDQFLADVRKNCTGLDTSYRPVDRQVVEDAPAD